MSEITLGSATRTEGTSDPTTFSGATSGTGGLIKQASGALTLSSVLSSFRGGTTIGTGTVVADSDASLGNSAAGLTFAGGTLEWNEGASSVTSSRNMVVNSGGGTIIAASSGLVTMSGTVSGAGGLTAWGPLTLSGAMSQSGNLLVTAGNVTLTGADTFAGGSTITAGTPQLGVGGSLLSTGAVAVDGGTFALNRNGQTISDLSGTGGMFTLGGGSLTEGTADNTSFASVISGSGALVKTGTGTLMLTAANSISGGVTLQAGTLELGGSGSIGSGTIDFASPAATLRIDGGTAPTNITSHFVAGDRIDLHGIAYNAGDILNYTTSTGELDVINSGNTVASLFFGAGNTLVDDPFHIGDETAGTGIVITNDLPCFLRGTRIRTDRGEVAVETLAVGTAS